MPTGWRPSPGSAGDSCHAHCTLARVRERSGGGATSAQPTHQRGARAGSSKGTHENHLRGPAATAEVQRGQPEEPAEHSRRSAPGPLATGGPRWPQVDRTKSLATLSVRFYLGLRNGGPCSK